jgi:hypothetical protein
MSGGRCPSRTLTPLALAAALLQTACTVHVDGAPCAVPGTTTDCPADQACGNDLRCSARALACIASRCTPNVASCSSSKVATSVRCDHAADPVCGRLVEEDCGARGLVCGASRSGACECPEYVGTVVVAHPGGSPSRSAVPFPRGQASPRECSFGTLTDAFATLAGTTAPSLVVIAGGDPGADVVFGTATGESWPLVVPANVTVRAAPAPSGASVIRGGTDPAAIGTLVRVQGTLEHIRIEGGGASGVGLELTCGAAGAPVLRDVVVDGVGHLDPGLAITPALRAGVAVVGSCGATLERVGVTGVAGPALSVEPGAGAVQVAGGSYSGSEIGVWLRGGSTLLVPDGASSVSVSGNAWLGVLVGGGVAAPAPLVSVPGATLDRVVVSGNGGVGVVISRLVEASSSVQLRGCDVSANGRDPARIVTSGPSGNERPVGGALIAVQTPAIIGYRGNRLWSNSGDQLVIDSDSSWQLGPGSCGADTNLFACVSEGPAQYSLRKVGAAGTVTAVFCRWPGSPPTNYVSPGVVGVASKFCTGATLDEPAMPACIP